MRVRREGGIEWEEREAERVGREVEETAEKSEGVKGRGREWVGREAGKSGKRGGRDGVKK